MGLTRSLADGLVGGYDIDGPRVRLGLLWFVVLLVAIALGPWPLAVVMALVAGAAGSQTAAAWRRVGPARQRARGRAGRAGPAAGRGAGHGVAGPGCVVVAVVALVTAAVTDAPAPPPRAGPMAGLTLRCGFPVGPGRGLAGGHPPPGDRRRGVAGAAGVAYDLGDFLVGTGAATPIEGPVAGIVAALVVAFALGVFAVPPFVMSSALVFGGLAAVLFPLGQLVATELLPAAAARAQALRRLDSLLLVGPLWMAALWRFLQ